MIAIINPNYAIWDSHILKFFNLKPISLKNKDRINKTIEQYQILNDKMNELLRTQEILETLDDFDKMIPSLKWINQMKKLDTIIWKKSRIELA